jgi:hypothetical protein
MSISRLIFRGALGGLVRGPLFLIGLTLHDIFRLGYTPYGGALQIMALPYVLVVGLVLGSIIGCMVWALAGKAKIPLPAIARAILGAGFVFLLFGLIHLISEETRGVYPPTPMEQLINGAMFVTAVRSATSNTRTPRQRRKRRHLTKACSGRAISRSLMRGLSPALVRARR